MKKFILFLNLVCLNLTIYGQDGCPPPSAIHFTEANQISAPINNGGYPFLEDLMTNTPSFVSSSNNPNGASTIYSSGLWLGGIDANNNIRVSTPTAGNSSSYQAGPVHTISGDSTTCANWDKVWVVTSDQIKAHRVDFIEDGVINTIIPEIFSWPANGNLYFNGYAGFEIPPNDPSLAPFFDFNQDGFYNPASGDYPLPNHVASNVIPSEITYSLFNDRRLVGSGSNYAPLHLQIGQTTYTYNCEGNNSLNNTVFVAYQMTNKGLSTVDSVFLGMQVDFDLGCHLDDYIGCDSSRNAFFAYNQDNTDGIDDTNLCDDSLTFGENPPVQAVTFLNNPLNFFSYYENGGQGGSGMLEPNTPIEYYRYLSGSWRDGSPLEYGGNGYQEGTIQTTHAFPDDPSNPGGWSMNTANLDVLNRRVIGSTSITGIAPGQSIAWDMAFTYIREEGASNLENVTAMYNQIDQIQALYDNQFIDSCVPTSTQDQAATDHQFKLFPNPTSGVLHIQFPDLTIQTLRLIDVTGKVVLEKKGQFQLETSLDLSAFSKGIYFLQMENGAQRFYEKISVQ